MVVSVTDANTDLVDCSLDEHLIRLDEHFVREGTRTVFDVVRYIGNGHVLLNPCVQWDEVKQGRFIESILIRLPMPAFYFAEDMQGRLTVVDGRQRLNAIARFLRNELCLNLPKRKSLHTKMFSQLDSRLQYRVEDCKLPYYIINYNAPEDVRLDIIERINS